MKKAVFLDRDGTINVEKDYLYKIEEFQYIDGVIEALFILGQLGFILVIITNQSGIARGYYTEDAFRRLNQWMLADLKKNKITISAVYHCPHCPQGSVAQYAVECDCRKPKTGLFWKAQKELNIDMSHSFVIGDKLRDLSVCKECSIQGILLSDIEKDMHRGIWVCHDLLHSAKKIREKENAIRGNHSKEQDFREY